MATKKDYYDVLGIAKGASEDEIRKAYRTLAKKYHPDVSSEPDAETRFKEIQEAYDTLSDADKRKSYDTYGHQGNPFEGFSGGSGFDGFSGFGGFSDIFNQFFGGQGRGRGGRKHGPMRGDDLERTMTVDFMEAALGTKKTVTVDVEEECPTCHGSGADSPSDIETCDRCHGAGHINVEQRTMFGAMRTQQVCPKCGGAGKTITKKCHTCNGQGRVRKSKTVDVNIPAGVDNNMSLKVAGYGNGGTDGGPAGDLFLTFRVRPHKVFKRHEDDIVLEIPITVTEAVLGTVVEVPTIYGDVKLTVKPGTQHGTRHRLRDKGIANVRTKRKGDQYVITTITVPDSISANEKKLYQQLSKLEESAKASAWTKFKNMFKS